MTWVVKVEGYRLTPEEMFMRNMENYVINCAKRYYINGLESDDIAQELRMHLWRRLPKYDPMKGKIETWGHMVVENKARDLHKKKVIDYYNGEIPEDFEDNSHFSCLVNGKTTHFCWDSVSKSYNLIEDNGDEINIKEKDGKNEEQNREIQERI